MKLIYVASPYSGDVENNKEYAKQACRFVMHQGHAFFAPHLLYPQILDDHNPIERGTGIGMALTLLEKCDELWTFGDRITTGMQLEVTRAAELGIPIKNILQLDQELSDFPSDNPSQESGPQL